jgi:hypothetical protein
MKYRMALLFLLSLSAGSAGATGPGVDIQAAVTRYSEFELTGRQTAILDEATKVSAAARVFHGLYDRWPSQVQELADRTQGIDFAVFAGKILIDEVPEGLMVTVFDSQDVRRLLATTGWPASPGMKESAQSPDFRIRVSLQSVPPPGGP